MSLSIKDVFNARRLPGRIPSELAAELLGFSKVDIPVLIQNKLLKPLGKPVPNAPKLFATVNIQELMSNSEWLSKATKALSAYWKGKNDRKFQNSSESMRMVA